MSARPQDITGPRRTVGGRRDHWRNRVPRADASRPTACQRL